MKIVLLVFMSEIKIDLTLKKSNFLFLLCFKNAIILTQEIGQERMPNGGFAGLTSRAIIM